MGFKGKEKVGEKMEGIGRGLMVERENRRGRREEGGIVER